MTTGSHKPDIGPSEPPDLRPHVPTCKLAVGFVRRGVIGAMFIRAGGWLCPGCIDEKVDAIHTHLVTVATSPLLWFGELDDPSRRAAVRQARRLPRAGRVAATRHKGPALMLAEANLTPRTRLLRPQPAKRAVVTFLTQLRDGPTPKRVDWGSSWRPVADTRTPQPAVRADMGPADMLAAAIEAAGFRTGVPIDGLSDLEIAEAISDEMSRIRAERDGVGWGPKKSSTETHVVS